MSGAGVIESSSFNSYRLLSVQETLFGYESGRATILLNACHLGLAACDWVRLNLLE